MREFMEEVREGFEEIWEKVKSEIFPLLFVSICCGINLGILMLLYNKGIITNWEKVVTLQSVFTTVLAYRTGKSVNE